MSCPTQLYRYIGGGGFGRGRRRLAALERPGEVSLHVSLFYSAIFSAARSQDRQIYPLRASKVSNGWRCENIG